MVLVASPSAIGSTPVASGSSVPPWPAFAAPVIRRTRATASAEVRPISLSSTSQPCSGRPRGLRGIVSLTAASLIIRFDIAGQIGRHLGLAQQFVDAAGAIEALVEAKAD